MAAGRNSTKTVASHSNFDREPNLASSVLGTTSLNLFTNNVKHAVPFFLFVSQRFRTLYFCIASRYSVVYDVNDVSQPQTVSLKRSLSERHFKLERPLDKYILRQDKQRI